MRGLLQLTSFKHEKNKLLDNLEKSTTPIVILEENLMGHVQFKSHKRQHFQLRLCYTINHLIYGEHPYVEGQKLRSFSHKPFPSQIKAKMFFQSIHLWTSLSYIILPNKPCITQGPKKKEKERFLSLINSNHINGQWSTNNLLVSMLQFPNILIHKKE